ncbi:MAG: CAP domain-containing protein, partial [Candidatus Limnocylindrales bacterium]
MPSLPRRLLQRLTPIALAGTLLISLVPVVSATEGVDTSGAAMAAAEQGALTLTNDQRAQRGLAALAWDAQMADLARQRAAYMAATGEFSHTHINGTSVFDMITASGITWYGAGEIIAWNNAEALDYSVAFAVQGWMGSPPHAAIVLSTEYDRVGFGMAISPATGKRYWAGVYLKGPAATTAPTAASATAIAAPAARIRLVSKTRVDARRVKVTLKWTGTNDRQAASEGQRIYQVQKRRDGGAWNTFDTTATSMTRVLQRGHVFQVRVRSRADGGTWS